jgi:hypothetical protein
MRVSSRCRVSHSATRTAKTPAANRETRLNMIIRPPCRLVIIARMALDCLPLCVRLCSAYLASGPFLSWNLAASPIVYSADVRVGDKEG